MAVRRLADEQPADFSFSPDNLEWAKRKIADYPEGRQASAVIPLLWRAQEQHAGWLPEPAIRLVADMLEMPYIRVLEIATFYTMFQLKPVGTVAHVNVCGTTPCMLRGSEALIAICKKRIAPHPFELSQDKRFSWEEVECAGACVNAPMVQIGAETYEDLDEDRFNALLDTLASGGTPEPGPQSARRASEPLSGLTSLTERKDEAPAADHSDTAESDATPDKDLDPTTPEARGEHAAKPSGMARTDEETTRGEPSAVEAATAASSEELKVASEGEGRPGADAPPPADAAPTPAPGEPVPAAEPVDAAAPAGAAEPADQVAVTRADEAGTRPPALTRETAGEIDNLQRISGIGPVIEGTLHHLGIFRFSQIAAWDQSHKDWVSAYLTFKGRIDRERWVEQAQAFEKARNGEAS